MDFGTRNAPKPAAPAAAPAGADVIKDTTSALFAKDVLEASKHTLVLVDFWAAWCEPCKALTPLIEKVVRGYGGKVRLVKLNIDQHPMIAEQLRVQKLPTVYAFRDGRPVDGFMGALPESQIKAFIDKHVGGEDAIDLEAALAAGDQAFEAGALQEAAEVYAAVLEEDAQNVGALTGLARCHLKAGDLARAEEMLALVPPAKKDSAAVAGVRAAIELARLGAKAGDVGLLAAKVAANGADHQARIDYATALAAGGQKDEAVEQLLASFRRDRNWNEQAARKQLVQLFDAWGPKDPATIDGRKRLSSVLFS